MLEAKFATNVTDDQGAHDFECNLCCTIFRSLKRIRTRLDVDVLALLPVVALTPSRGPHSLVPFGCGVNSFLCSCGVWISKMMWVG